jgi:hypothetical protein
MDIGENGNFGSVTESFCDGYKKRSNPHEYWGVTHVTDKNATQAEAEPRRNQKHTPHQLWTWGGPLG